MGVGGVEEGEHKDGNRRRGHADQELHDKAAHGYRGSAPGPASASMTARTAGPVEAVSTIVACSTSVEAASRAGVQLGHGHLGDEPRGPLDGLVDLAGRESDGSGDLPQQRVPFLERGSKVGVRLCQQPSAQAPAGLGCRHDRRGRPRGDACDESHDLTHGSPSRRLPTQRMALDADLSGL